MNQAAQAAGGVPVSALLEVRTYKEVVGLSDDDLEAIYGLAHGEYENGRYADAERTFTVLCLHDHRSERFWLGLGAARQQLNEFAGAVMAYSQAAEAGSTNPFVPLHAAECYFALGLYAEALHGLDVALDWASYNPEPGPIIDRVQALFEAFEKMEALSAEGEDR